MTDTAANWQPLFNSLWQQYLAVTPSALPIHELLRQQAANGQIVNDHIALRTFNLAPVNLAQLAAPFEALGYRAAGDYQFIAKKLQAKHFEHPDPLAPKVFISELLVDQFSPWLQQQVSHLIAQLPEDFTASPNWVSAGRPWSIDKETYQQLIAESEYAGWLAAWGYRANHFTVSINQLNNNPPLASINDQLLQVGYSLNTAGGLIKGSPAELLEQSSTLADRVACEFSDGKAEIASCFYEFAKRYPQSNGELYSGFVAASADKIFESTHQAK
ncbi:DUF1338 domain-containing protein [Neiella marina]|uniref:2-oxoadipate dioxygenase/decarboxylase n=1 Tax=Neiella holothuriorum TaxID=2870530 RepID=A0ABS7ECD7_9GAMM|nr:DUF1338 domain-containing protein [Neiella holothuriorum]MBW8189992.1 DUF1338 domain-containing protein [Neiella holothuriorum]